VCEPQNAEIQTAEEKPMIYLLHYDRPLHHAQHYLGSCDDPQRIQHHGNGTSRARLPQVFCQLGVQFVVARTWEGGRTGERKLKNQKNARVLCPICRIQKLNHRAKLKRARRAVRKLPFPEPTPVGPPRPERTANFANKAQQVFGAKIAISLKRFAPNIHYPLRSKSSHFAFVVLSEDGLQGFRRGWSILPSFKQLIRGSLR
jgi:hypothetical protein